MEYLSNILGFACIGVLWILSEPTIRLRELILRKHQGFFRRMLECAMCSTFHIYFWYHLIFLLEFDLLGAAIAAVLSEMIYNYMSNNLIG